MKELTKMNRGEWAETYVVLRLSGAKVLYECDAQLNSLPENFLRLQKILMRAKEIADTRIFDLRNDAEVVAFDSNEQCEMGRARNEEFKKVSDELLKILKSSQGRGRSFSVPAVEKFLREKLKSSVYRQEARIKQDLMITLLDRGSNRSRELGFSIKSHIGAKPTLVNASKATRFEYKLVGTLSASEIAEFNTKKNFSEKMRLLRDRRIGLEFMRCVNPVYERNLQTVDTQFPRVFAEMLKIHFEEGIKSLKDVAERVAQKNPLNLDTTGATPVYEIMMKRFLRQHALGMNAASAWNGHSGVSGGCIVVRRDGDIVCFYAYNFDELDEFLLRSSFFDTPSTRRHEYGKIVGDASTGLRLLLNFQIRETP